MTMQDKTAAMIKEALNEKLLRRLMRADGVDGNPARVLQDFREGTLAARDPNLKRKVHEWNEKFSPNRDVLNDWPTKAHQRNWTDATTEEFYARLERAQVAAEREASNTMMSGRHSPDDMVDFMAPGSRSIHGEPSTFFDPDTKAYRGYSSSVARTKAQLGRDMSDDAPRWFSAHPEVSQAYSGADVRTAGTDWHRQTSRTGGSTSYIDEINPKLVPAKEQGPWTPHVYADTRGKSLEEVSKLPVAPGPMDTKLPEYEKVMSKGPSERATVARYKNLPTGEWMRVMNKTSSTVKTRDIELWEAYKANPGPHTLQPLMKQLDPVIQAEVNRWAGAISRPVLEAKAKGLALEAIKSYNPNAGAALATHVTNRLKKISREVYTHQDAVRIPEYKKLKFNAYHRSTEELMSIHGREPTDVELSDHLGWSRKMVADVQRSMRPELIESLDTGAGLFERKSVWGSDSDDGLVDMLYFDLDPVDKLIFEHSTGYSGKPILSNPQLAAKTGLTQGQLSYRKRRIIDNVSKIMD